MGLPPGCHRSSPVRSGASSLSEEDDILDAAVAEIRIGQKEPPSKSACKPRNNANEKRIGRGKNGLFTLKEERVKSRDKWEERAVNSSTGFMFQ